MLRFRRGYIFLVLLLTAGWGGCAGPRLMGWKCKSGDSYSLQVTLESNLIMRPFPNADYKHSQMQLDCQVLEIDPEHRAKVQVTIESIKARMQSLTKKFAYDSAKDKYNPKVGQDLAGQTQKFVNAFASLPGKKYTVLVDAVDKKVTLLDMDEEIRQSAYGPAGKDMFGGAQVKMLLSEANLVEYPTAGLLIDAEIVPPDPCESWVGSGTVLVPYTPVVHVKKDFVVKTVEDGKDPNTVIEYKITRVPEEEAKASAGASSRESFNVESLTGKGRIDFSMKKGHLLKMKEWVQMYISSKQVSRPPASADAEKRKSNIFYLINKTVKYID